MEYPKSYDSLFMFLHLYFIIFMIYKLQDGSYSRGPMDIPVGESDDTKYFISPTFKFEQVSLSCFLQDIIIIDLSLM